MRKSIRGSVKDQTKPYEIDYRPTSQANQNIVKKFVLTKFRSIGGGIKVSGATA